jgi:hypothetical protein
MKLGMLRFTAPALALLGACSSSTSSGPPGNGAPDGGASDGATAETGADGGAQDGSPDGGGCQITLTGDISASFPCTAGVIASPGNPSVFTVAVDPTAAPGYDTIGSQIEFAGSPTAKTYTAADYTLAQATVMTAGAAKTYVARLHAQSADIGTFGALTFDSVQPTATGDAVHGTLQVTLQQEPDAGAGQLQAQIQF